MAPEPLTIPAGTDLPKIFDVLSDAPASSAAPVVEGDRLVGVHDPQGRAALGALPPGRRTPTGGC